MFLKTEEIDKILYVRLNRPDVRNALNADMMAQIKDIFVKASAQSDLRAIVLRGEGKAYCAGADLQHMQSMVNFSLEENKADADALFSMFESIWLCPVPVISVVHGAAFGGAMGLLAVSDLVLCEEKTQLCFSEVKLGIAPAVISSFILNKVSLAAVSPWMLSARVMSAEQARQVGLVHQVLDAIQLETELGKWLQAFRQSGPEAMRETKHMIQRVSRLSVIESRDLTSGVIAERRVSAEGQEGLKSFLEKRDPQWR